MEQLLSFLKLENWQDNFDKVIDQLLLVCTDMGLRICAAIFIFFAGKWVVGRVRNIAVKMMDKSKVDKTLSTFAGHFIFFAGMAFVCIVALDKLGIQTATFIAAIGAAGLAVGLAFQGSLGNFASGVLIIIFRPVKVGDLVEIDGYFGEVEMIEIFTTVLTTLDNKTVIIPNSTITSGSLLNYSKTEDVRMDLVFGASYEDDIEKVRETLMNVLNSHELVLKDPAPFVAVFEYADSSINYAARPWVKVRDYWTVYFDIHDEVKKAFDKEGISIPFPQRDVHMIPVEAEAVSSES